MSIEWDGKGLPPVGCECEREVPGGWDKCKINYLSDAVIVYEMIGSGNEYASNPYRFTFRPTRTEAERRREEAIKAIHEEWPGSPVLWDAFEVIYNDIAAGKISGIRLTDDAGS